MSDVKDIKHPVKGLNLMIKETKDDIATAINKAQLPPGIMLMVLEGFTNQVQALNAQMIAAERKAFEQEGVKPDGKALH